MATRGRRPSSTSGATTAARTRAGPIEAAFPAFLTPVAAKIEPVPLPAEARHPGLRPFVLDGHLRAADRRISEARRAIEATGGGPAEIERAEKALATAEAGRASIEARGAAERARHRQPPPEHLPALIAEAARLEKVAAAAKADEAASRAGFDLIVRRRPREREAAGKKLEAARVALEAARKAVAAPGESYTPLPGSRKTLESNLETEESRGKPFPKVSTGRRSALARWITDPKHPLPARVAVNHLWARHFGRPLVPTVFDFGRKGTPPTHPELLDWLAVELVEHDWSMKHIHRLMVTSQAYRMLSSNAGAAPDTLARDRENKFYWRAILIAHGSFRPIRDSYVAPGGRIGSGAGRSVDSGQRRNFATAQLVLRPFPYRSAEVPRNVRQRQRARLLPPLREHRAATGVGS